jgi:uncharacterized membrane protein YhhN
MTSFLTLSALLTGLLHIRAEYYGPRRQVYLLKPLTTSLILLLAWQVDLPVTPFYQTAVVVGLFFSLLGDIFLMLPSDHFVHGLVSFLLAHLWYVGAFASQSSTLPWLTLAGFVLYGGLMLRWLWPYLGAFKIAVLCYMAVILLMGWQALGQWQSAASNRALWALGGALLFILSDSALALDRFRRPFPAARAVVLGTYYVAQILIAWSVA